MFKLLATTAVTIAMLSPAFATDFSKKLTDPEGNLICTKVIKEDQDCPADQIATLGRTIRGALYATFPDEANLSLDEKLKRGDLAQALVGASEDVKFKAEDIALMKKVVGKAYGPLVVWAVVRELEPKDAK